MSSIESRKMDHIRICLEEKVTGSQITTGFEAYRFEHNALPQLDFAKLDTTTSFLGRELKVPFVVSSMTGGTQEAAAINERLAAAAQERGWALGVGSVRAAVEQKELGYTFAVRKFAPDVPIFANLGAVQLNYGYGVDECRRAVELVEADGLVLHLNALQEVFQPEGNTNFAGLLAKIEKLCSDLAVPVGVKEVGWGLSAPVAKQLHDAGVRFLDTAGAGGTSWSEVERLRRRGTVLAAAAEAFADWGIPSAECIKGARAAVPAATLIGSGGLRNGVEAAKGIALGADLIGFGRALLAPAVHSAEALAELFERLELELRAAMFGIGAGSLAELKGTALLRSVQKTNPQS